MPHKQPPTHSQFKPGQSGNPSGKRKGITVSRCLREMLELNPAKDFRAPKTYAHSIAQRLIRDAVDGDHNAVTTVLNRTEGKVPDQLQVESYDGSEIARKLAAARVKHERNGNGRPDRGGVGSVPE